MTGYLRTAIIYFCLVVSCVQGCDPVQANCTCVANFQATSDTNGPDHPRHLGSKVIFEASANWAVNLSIGFKAYVNNTLIMTYPRSSYNMSCGSKMSRSFIFVNERMDDQNPSGYPVVDVVLYADHPDNPDGGAVACNNSLCTKFQVYYNFPPGPDNIDVILDPADAVQGQPAAVSCFTRDGYPEVQFGIRAFSLVYNYELFYSPEQSLAMPKAIAGSYVCEAISYIFGQKMVVPSHKRVNILRNPMAAADTGSRLGDQFGSGDTDTYGEGRARWTIYPVSQVDYRQGNRRYKDSNVTQMTGEANRGSQRNGSKGKIIRIMEELGENGAENATANGKLEPEALHSHASRPSYNGVAILMAVGLVIWSQCSLIPALPRFVLVSTRSWL